jgi:hypothetical protein
MARASLNAEIGCADVQFPVISQTSEEAPTRPQCDLYDELLRAMPP